MNDFKEFARIQNELKKKVVIKKPDYEFKIIAGCDTSIINQEFLFSVFVLFEFANLNELEIAYNKSKITVPYVPGFLSFREAPNLLRAFKKLTQKPDLIIVDGNGIIHPKHLGIASHIGVQLNIPTIGVAKNLLYGNYKMPGPLKGSYSPVLDIEGSEIGYALRTKNNVKPVFVSPGHLIDTETSLQIVLQTLGKYRLPEVTRIADKYSKELKQNYLN